MKILVAGAGYIGLPLAQELLKQNHDVTGWVNSEGSREKLFKAGLNVIQADISKEDSWNNFSEEWDAVIYCVSSSRGGVEAYRAVHEQGLALALETQPSIFIYTSSTSVYGQKDGSVVDENSPTEPESPTSQMLVQAEKEVLKNGGMVARLAGIYGPERQHLIQKIQRGETMEDRWLNQIHRDDAVNALKFLLEHPTEGVFNVCDNEPVLWSDFCKWTCEKLQLPLPTQLSSSEKPRKRGKTNKRVSNEKLKSLDWQSFFPSYREGYSSILF